MRRTGCCLWLLLAGLAGVAGCQAARPTLPAVGVATPDAPHSPATLSFDQIGAEPKLPAPATRPADAGERPPIEAVALFAQGYSALQTGDRPTAASLLDRAASLDSTSYSIWYELGRARAIGLGHVPAAVDALLRAAELEPDHLAVQLDLARQYLAAGDRGAALYRLRLAIQTADYAGADPRRPEADYLLAQVLADLGYDRAALERFELLAARMERASYGWLASPLAPQAASRLYLQIGDLYLRQGVAGPAINAYRRAETVRGSTFDLQVQTRLTRALLVAGRETEALDVAEQAVRRGNASAASIDLLRDTYRLAGEPAPAAAETLARLHRKHPADRAILSALVRLLHEGGRSPDAAALLAAARSRSPGDPAVVMLHVSLLHETGQTEQAIRVVIEALARNPHLDVLIDPAWRALAPASGRGCVAPAVAGAVPVATHLEAVRAYVAARLAVEQGRDVEARRWLTAAMRPPGGGAPFAPAGRLLMRLTLSDGQLPLEVRRSRAAAICEAVRGDPPLQEELAGELALLSGRRTSAASAVAQPALPADRLVRSRLAARAAEAVAAGNALAELAALTRDFPTFGDAHDALHAALREGGDVASADASLAAWEHALPDDIRPRLRRVEDLLADGRAEAAELVLAELDASFPADARRLDLLAELYRRTARADRFAATLEQLLGESDRLGPAGRGSVAARLAGVYADAGRRADAARASASGDADRLLLLSWLCWRAGMSDSAPPLLEEAAAADPKHSGVAAALALAICESDGALQDPAALARAVDLARRAVEAEPDRPAYRAALGRALYRSGWIAAAADELAAALEPTDAKWSLVAATSPAMTPPATTTAPAVTPSTRPADGGEADGHHDGVDAVWLDHLGDALYRLGRSEAAGQAWERARRRLAATDTDVPGRPELARLRLAVPRKLQQLAAGQTVAVSASARLDARNSP